MLPGPTCARPGSSRSASSTRQAASGAPGTGTATPASCATSSRTCTSPCSRSSATSPPALRVGRGDPATTSGASPSATTYDDALFHTGVTRAEWHEDEARWLVHTDRGDEIRCRWYVLAAGILNLLKLPAIAGMEDFAATRSTRRAGTTSTPAAGPRSRSTGPQDKVVALLGTGASGIQCLPPLAESAQHVYVFQRTPSAIGERGNRPTDPEFAETLEPGWQRARMDNFQAIMLGRPVEVDQVDDGWTHHFAAVNHPQVRGHDLAEYIGAPNPTDFEVMEAHRRRVDELVQDPDQGGDPQALLPLHLQAALLPRRVPLGLQQPQRHPHRLPRRHGAHHPDGPGRERRALRGRLHRLRHRLRTRAHPPLPPGRPRHRGARRRHPGREVGGRGRQPLRHHEQGFPNLFLMPAPPSRPWSR